MVIKTGMFIENRYEILEKIGSGGMSDVYKAKCHKLNRFVAIKFLKQEYCEDANFVKNFQIEAQNAAALLHPNVVSVYDVNETDGVYYIVMEYVNGITLKKYIDRNGNLPVKEATSIAIQVAQGIDAAHSAGIIHRDIKPQNVLISREGKIKVTDFGIARTTTANTVSTDILGSVQYISPEQARGAQVDERTDIYSFGIVFYEMITGQLPFDGESTVAIALKHIQENVPLVSDIVEGVPNSVVRIIEKCTQRKPDRRYQKTTSLLTDLKTSLLTPNEDFVVLEPETTDTATIILSEEDAELLRNQKADTHTLRRGPLRNRIKEQEKAAVKEEITEKKAPVRDTGKIKTNNKKSDSREKKKKKSAVLICAIVAAVIVVAVLGFIYIKKIRPAAQEETTTEEPQIEQNEVPRVVGMSMTSAKSSLEKQGFVVKLKYEHNDAIAKEYVIEQSVKNGTLLDVGSEITLTVSSGQETTKLGDYAGMELSEAEETLKKQGFKSSVAYKYSDDVPYGIVIETNPVKNSEVAKDAVIELVVSQGPEIYYSDVPYLYGYTEADAKAELNNRNLNYWVDYIESEGNEGLVVEQWPYGGNTVEQWSTISIYIGKEPETTQPVEPVTEEPVTEEPVTEPPTETQTETTSEEN